MLEGAAVAAHATEGWTPALLDGAPSAPLVCPHDPSLYSIEIRSAEGHHVWIVDENHAGTRAVMQPRETSSPLVDFESMPLATYSGRFRWSPAPITSGDHAFAFVSTADEAAEVYVGSTGTRDVVRVTEESGIAGAPEWSPDGDRLYFVGVDAGRAVLRCVRGVSDLVAATTGGGAAPLEMTTMAGPEPGDGVVSVSADGRWVAFVVRRSEDRSGSDLWVASTAETWGGATAFPLTRLPGDETRPSWSPTGRWIAFYHAPSRSSPALEILCAQVDLPGEARRTGWVAAPGVVAPRVSGYLEIERDATGEMEMPATWFQGHGGSAETLAYVARPHPGGSDVLELASPDRAERGLPSRETIPTVLDVIQGGAFGLGRAVLCGQRGDDYCAIRADVAPSWAASGEKVAEEGTLR